VAEDQLVYGPMREHLDIDELVDGWLGTDHNLEEALLAVDKKRVKDLDAVRALFATHRQMLEEDAFVRMRDGLERDQLVALGEAVQDVVRTAPTHPHPHNPDEGFLETMADTLSAEIDHLRDSRHKDKH